MMISFESHRKFKTAFKKRLWNFLNSKKFLTFGTNVYIEDPYLIHGAESISIGNNVFFAKDAWLAFYNANSLEKKGIVIGDEVYVGRMSHFACIDSILIENGVMMADKVFISDHNHDTLNPSVSVKKRGLSLISPVVIAKNTWIGEGVVILGASVGEGSIIGAGAVVLSDIPPFSMAVGQPARVVKVYCKNTKNWIKK